MQTIKPPTSTFLTPSSQAHFVIGNAVDADGVKQPIGLSYQALRHGLQVVGPMGTGKTEWLVSLIQGMFSHGQGCMVLDCRGSDLPSAVLLNVPRHQEGDIVVLNIKGMQLGNETLYSTFGNHAWFSEHFSQRVRSNMIFQRLFSSNLQGINIKQMRDAGQYFLAGIPLYNREPSELSELPFWLLSALLSLVVRDSTDHETLWPIIIDEAQHFFHEAVRPQQILADARASGIGFVLSHQDNEQATFPIEVEVQSRMLFDSAAELFQSVYVQLGEGIFPVSMNPLLDRQWQDQRETPSLDWEAITAPSKSQQDDALDALHSRLMNIYQQDRLEAEIELRDICKSPTAFQAYCARTKAHRVARREFLLTNPEAIPNKEQRIRTLSALAVDVPELELMAAFRGAGAE